MINQVNLLIKINTLILLIPQRVDNGRVPTGVIYSVSHDNLQIISFLTYEFLAC